jgi:hypothetical protein
MKFVLTMTFPVTIYLSLRFVELLSIKEGLF